MALSPEETALRKSSISSKRRSSSIAIDGYANIGYLNYRTSPEIWSKSQLRRKRIQLYLSQSSAGLVLDILNAIFSVVSCVVTISKPYLDDESVETRLYVIDLVVCSFFFADYLLRLYIADSFIIQFVSKWAIIDLLTILPAFTPLSFFGARPDMSNLEVFFRGAVEFVGILRLYRTRRVVAYIASELRREILSITLNLITSVLFMGSLLHLIENTYRAAMLFPYIELHDTYYFLVVTMSTLGYGDISMKSFYGRILIILFILYEIYYVPTQTNKVLGILSKSSVYETRSYTPHPNIKHIVITGFIDPSSANDLLVELFHEDHGNIAIHVVVLIPGSPSKKLSDILEHGRYSEHITVIAGSPFNSKDLVRAAMDSAITCIIATNKFSKVPEKFDAGTILRTLAIKRYVFRMVGMDISCVVQLIRPESKYLFSISKASLPFVVFDPIISVEQIKMDIIAKASVCPGFCIFIHNLVASIQSVSSETRNSDDDQHASVLRSNELTTEQCNMQYMEGSCYEIYKTDLAAEFSNIQFAVAAGTLYSMFGITLFALELSLPHNPAHKRIFLNPGTFVIPDVRKYSVSAYVLALNAEQSNLSFSRVQINPSIPSVRNRATFVKLLNSKMFTRTDTDQTTISMSLPRDNGLLDIYEGEEEVEEEEEMKEIEEPGEKKEEFAELDDYFVNKKHIRLSNATILSSVEQELPMIREHFVVIGEIEDLPGLVRTLRAKSIGHITPIVFLAPENPPPKIWHKLSIFPLVFHVQGSAFNQADLQRTGIKFAKHAIVTSLIGHLDNIHNLRDSYTMYLKKKLVSMNPNIDVVIEITNRDNLHILERNESQPEPTNSFRISQKDSRSSFEGLDELMDTFVHDKMHMLRNENISVDAAGDIFNAGTIDTLTCQAFFNSHIVGIVQQLVSGSCGNTALQKTKKVMQQDPVIGDIEESILQHIRCPVNMVGQTYGNLFDFLADDGAIPLGLYRTSGEMPTQDKYMYTNPSKKTILRESDRVYVLSSKIVCQEQFPEYNIESIYASVAARHMSTVERLKRGTNLDKYQAFNLEKEVDTEIEKLSKQLAEMSSIKSKLSQIGAGGSKE